MTNDPWTTPLVLTGQEVRLEPLSRLHIPGLVAAGKDPIIWKYMVYGNLSMPENMSAWVDQLLEKQAEGTDLCFTVIHQASGRIAGATRFLEMHPEHRSLELGGTWYGVAYQHTGVNTECKYLLLQHAFENLGCIRVQFKVDARNERSILAIERIGAQREGLLRNHMILQDGEIRDFALLQHPRPGMAAGEAFT